MRILHVFDHSLPLQSGYVYRSLGILTAQRARGWETVHVTTPRQGPTAAAVETVDGWTFHRTAMPPAWAMGIPVLRELAEMRATASRLIEVAKETKPDILHAHSPVLNPLPALWAGRQLGLPVVYELRAFWEDAATDLGTSAPHGLRFYSSRMVDTWVMRGADAIATLCEGMRQEIANRGIPREKITVVPNAVDAERFAFGIAPDLELKAKLKLDGAVVLGFLGSFYRYEGLDFLIEALPAALAAVPNLRVLLVGGGPQEARLKALAQQHGVADKVIFAGRVKNSEVDRYYSLIDMFVCPRHSIRLTELVTPLKPLEAMALGKVVVASDVGGHKELVRDGDTGFLFRADDPDSFCQLLARIAGQQELLARVARAGRRFVEEERRWSISVANYQPVYERLTAGRGVTSR